MTWLNKDTVACVWGVCYFCESVETYLMTIKIYGFIILPFVLYGCETWSLRLTVSHWLRVFENRALRNMSGAKRKEVSEQWRKLRNDRPLDFYFSWNLIWVIKWRGMRWVGHVACMARSKIHAGFWWRNLKGRDHSDKPGYRWEDCNNN